MHILSDTTIDQEELMPRPSDFQKTLKHLESKISDLLPYKIKCEALSLELSHMKTLKQKFEELYNEASIKLIFMDNEDIISLAESDQISNLNKKLNLIMNANEMLKRKLEESQATIFSLTEENKTLKETNKSSSLKMINRETNTDGIVCGDLENLRIFSVSTFQNYLPEIVPENTVKLTKSSINFTQEIKKKYSSILNVSRLPKQVFANDTVQSIKSRSASRVSPKPAIHQKSRTVYQPSFLRKQLKQ